MTAGAAAPPDGDQRVDLAPPLKRDPYIDFVRAFSLLVVVAWHWMFNVIVWTPTGPYATNPIGFTSGMWVLTWLFQVMPLFFLVGGFVHLQSWDRAATRGRSQRSWVAGQVRSLVVPSLALLATWLVIGAVGFFFFDVQWMLSAALLVVSPLWFIAVYVALILLFPVTRWLHLRWGPIVLVWLAGLAWIVDTVRFRDSNDWIGWANMLLVWVLCHQLGYFWADLVRAGQRVAWMLLWGGLFTLFALVYSDVYPGSMVGVPGDRLSNMAPPTMCMVALVVFQCGAALLLRPWVLVRLPRPRWARVNETINRFAMPLFLFHTTGMAISQGILHALVPDPEPWQPDLGWWLTRPLAVIGPLLFTLPVIWLFGRRWTKPVARPPSPQPAAPQPA